MKNIVENQGIKTDKPLPMSYEALKAERDALEVRLRNALSSEQEAIQRAHAANQTADALAVENAAMKKFCKNAAFDADYESELCMERGGFTDALNNIETPATSAALAAIQAQGVEKFVTKIAKQLREAGGERGYNLVDWCEYAEHLEDRGEKFATELREGK